MPEQGHAPEPELAGEFAPLSYVNSRSGDAGRSPRTGTTALFLARFNGARDRSDYRGW